MQTRLARARATREMTQSQVIAELIRRSDAAGMSVASPGSLKVLLSSFENGRREVNEPYRMLFRAIYGMTDAELFEPVVSAEAPDDRDAEYEALAERVFAAKRVTASTAELLAQQTHHIRTLDRTVPAALLFDQMNSHLATVQEALSHAILPSIRRPLAAVLADASALAAWHALDVGAMTRTWRHHETARYAALEAQNPVLLAHALAQQAFVLVEIGDVASAAELIEEAHHQADGKVPERFAAWLSAAEGEVAATAGDTSRMARCFDKASRLVPAGGEAVDPDMPYIILNDAHLARWRGNALAKLGSHDAIGDLLTALRDGGTVTDRAEASLRCDLAQSLAQAGDFQEARLHAVEARRAARRAGSVRQRRRIERLALLD